MSRTRTLPWRDSNLLWKVSNQKWMWWVKNQLRTKCSGSSEAGVVAFPHGALGRCAEDTTSVVSFCESLSFLCLIFLWWRKKEAQQFWKSVLPSFGHFILERWQLVLLLSIISPQSQNSKTLMHYCKSTNPSHLIFLSSLHVIYEVQATYVWQDWRKTNNAVSAFQSHQWTELQPSSRHCGL